MSKVTQFVLDQAIFVADLGKAYGPGIVTVSNKDVAAAIQARLPNFTVKDQDDKKVVKQKKGKAKPKPPVKESKPKAKAKTKPVVKAEVKEDKPEEVTLPNVEDFLPKSK